MTSGLARRTRLLGDSLKKPSLANRTPQILSRKVIHGDTRHPSLHNMIQSKPATRVYCFTSAKVQSLGCTMPRSDTVTRRLRCRTLGQNDRSPRAFVQLVSVSSSVGWMGSGWTERVGAGARRSALAARDKLPDARCHSSSPVEQHQEHEAKLCFLSSVSHLGRLELCLHVQTCAPRGETTFHNHKKRAHTTKMFRVSERLLTTKFHSVRVLCGSQRAQDVRSANMCDKLRTCRAISYQVKIESHHTKSHSTTSPNIIAYHLRENDYRYRSEIKSKTIGL